MPNWCRSTVTTASLRLRSDRGVTDDDDTSEEGTAVIIDEFQSFLENVNPEDFAP